MARRLARKIAVVTGGTTWMGFASATRFAAEGVRVFITGPRQAELDKAVAAIGENVTGFQADSAKMTDLNRLYAQVKADAGRIAWAFGPPHEPRRITGLDVAIVSAGRISALYTFLDPTGA
jgi:NAD(P)-dependent dehydrogenase (short-subunit alcohol dehydrogenase family)